eukprot:CAMPEP_0180135382 /NCGR_PEP_ID=MMETSP0986-20121125/10806_1 /TAXON_ID=697907 /ORGANISM="non described non described, Strain CCMP2293" /LENGTH=52 /DNA_ID=CAMNT_0022076087 /DNA_START=291 /DNA_END=449 /DNA_ORIENTATION=-
MDAAPGTTLPELRCSDSPPLVLADNVLDRCQSPDYRAVDVEDGGDFRTSLPC